MTDRVKLVELIKSAKAAMRGKEFICNLEREYFTAEYLIAHGVTVRQMQKPLTVEEIERMAAEREGHDWPLDDVPPILCAEMKNGRTFWINWGTAVDALVLIEAYENLRNKAGYNKQWRLWLRKPNEEEREAAEWL